MDLIYSCYKRPLFSLLLLLPSSSHHDIIVEQTHQIEPDNALSSFLSRWHQHCIETLYLGRKFGGEVQLKADIEKPNIKKHFWLFIKYWFAFADIRCSALDCSTTLNPPNRGTLVLGEKIFFHISSVVLHIPDMNTLCLIKRKSISKQAFILFIWRLITTLWFHSPLVKRKYIYA